ncbi:MAG: UDP-glucose--hexose-1-phosphate uridylyltransferase [Pelagibacterales bacterium]|jgi:UDPglucose--hexose-1-phosphate uridylyltransferase|nr:UDP-glucose--hexose-1-phosphate uridylyltransferase [Pelagibacterales bacterium]MBT6447232.1 UDP-glucose--hexose-1-phosphate uridylyltransferase [Flavobacteriaceae bacterium]
MTFNQLSHRRKNILTGEWVLVSPNRTKRPWQGKKEIKTKINSINYDPDCYLCPGNLRVNNEKTPTYSDTYSFTNDFSALLDSRENNFKEGLLEAHSESGICKVLCYSPNHSITIPLMSINEILLVIKLWQDEYKNLGSLKSINHVQIFENKGEIMGCSNAHPHGQIWAQKRIPKEVEKKQFHQKEYYKKNNTSLLLDYLNQELELRERIICENSSFLALIPYWAVWPFETMIIPKKQHKSILSFSGNELVDYAKILKKLTTKYDNLFNTSFPYSSGIHQAPTDNKKNEEWHMHMSFYPPLLRSANVKKFMVGYEMFAEPQRDITAETAAEKLRNCSEKHFTETM